MSAGVNLPPELLELVGSFSAAAKSVKAEIRELDKEAKKAAKEGRSLTKEQRERRDFLQDKYDSLNEKKKEAKQQKSDVEKSLGNRAISFHSRAMRLGNAIRTGNVSEIATFAQSHAVPALQRLGLGKAAEKVASASSSVISSAARIAPPVAIGAAIVYGTSKIIKEYYMSRAREVEGDGVAMAHMANILSQDATGTKYTASFAENMMQGTQETKAMVQKGLIESNGLSRIRQTLGFGVNARTATLGTQAEIQKQKVSLLVRRFGEQAAGAFDIQAIKDSPAGESQARLILTGTKTTGGGAIGAAGRLLHEGMIWAKDFYTSSDTLEEEMTAWAIQEQAKRINAAGNESRRIARLRTVSPKLRDNEKQQSILFGAINELKYDAGLQWNKF
jgi:regulator of replication initiation timing